MFSLFTHSNKKNSLNNNSYNKTVNSKILGLLFPNISNTSVFIKSSFTAALVLISSFAVSQQAEQESIHPIAIAIHGGAGTITKANLSDEQEAAYKLAIDTALNIGYEQLSAGNDGLDAIVAAIMYLEDSPLFNAGVGAVYTYDGRHELDASIMRGDTLEAGAIASVSNIKNPIVAARLVMEESVHVMLSGQGAEQFALEHGVTEVDNKVFNTSRRFEALQRAKKEIDESAGGSAGAAVYNAEFNDFKFGTVGVVVLDKNGNISAGTSTGGMTAKRYGRVGDSPIIGAGTYADNASCAVSATGHGEYFIRYNVAADICARMKYKGLSLEDASDAVIHDVLLPAGGTGGVVAIDAKGNIAMPFNTEGMYRGSIDTNGKKTVLIYKE